MSDEDTSNTDASQVEGDTKTDTAAPPWGSEEDFNPEKAWKLIQGLRGDKESLTADRDKYKQAHDAAETAKLSDIERANRERDDALSSASQNGVELARLRAAIKYGLDEDDLEFVGGNTPEEIDTSAKKLADRLGQQQATTSTTRTRPTERLRGGGEPDSDPAPDLSKIAAEIPRR